jgi:hypothetical protein
MNHEERRHASQLAFAASGQELCFGELPDGLSAFQLAKTTGAESYVVEELKGGLTAKIFRIRAAGCEWTLKQARAACLVQNVDGQTSFLNEVQRRIELSALKQSSMAGSQPRFTAVIETQFASYQHGIILSPWIAGSEVKVWDALKLRQLFSAMHELVLAGFFEWDFCSGNILDDGKIRLFDFGYMYRFDPLQDFNSNGRATPMFHPIERFETRLFFAYLLQLEKDAGRDAALQAFRLEKIIAVEACRALVEDLRTRGAHAEVLAWIMSFITQWDGALQGDLDALYVAEGWRSHRLDVDDDLRGQTCTPMTLQRIDWLENAVNEKFAMLKTLNVLFDADSSRTLPELERDLVEARAKAIIWQIKK